MWRGVAAAVLVEMRPGGPLRSVVTVVVCGDGLVVVDIVVVVAPIGPWYPRWLVGSLASRCLGLGVWVPRSVAAEGRPARRPAGPSRACKAAQGYN